MIGQHISTTGMDPSCAQCQTEYMSAERMALVFMVFQIAFVVGVLYLATTKGLLWLLLFLFSPKYEAKITHDHVPNTPNSQRED